MLGRNGSENGERELFGARFQSMRERPDLFAKFRVDELFGSGEKFRSGNDRGRSHGGDRFSFLFRCASAAEPEFDPEDGHSVGHELFKEAFGEVSQS